MKVPVILCDMEKARRFADMLASADRLRVWPEHADSPSWNAYRLDAQQRFLSAFKVEAQE